MLLPFSPGIIGHYNDRNDTLSLELRSLRSLRTVTFFIKDQTVINTIEAGFSPILEDYLGDTLPGFSDTFFEMQSHPIPLPGEERVFNIAKNTSMKFCWIPAGEAQLGLSKEEQDYFEKIFFRGKRLSYWRDMESEAVRGIHKSNGFWLGKYPVTQAQWQGVMGNNPSHFKGDNLPVECVSWDDCQHFIKKCSVSELKVRLPHEDHWEYAYQGGKGNKQPFYWGNTLNGDKANCDGKYPHRTNKKGIYLGRTSEVGSYEKVAPHPWGLCDMSGNVLEWCENLYDKDELSLVIRGGCWDYYSRDCRSSDRLGRHPTSRDEFIGFRLAIC